MDMIMLRKGLMALVLSAGVLSLAACGIKSSPDFPKDANYPLQYPAPGKQSKAPSIVVSPAPSPDTAAPSKETKDGARSPLGFPLEYPNRSSYN